MSTMGYQCNKDSIFKAIKLCEQAIKADSLCDGAYSTEASMFIQLREYRNAIDILNKYDKISNCNITMTILKGYLYEKIGSQDTANIIYKSCLLRYDSRIKDDPTNSLLEINRIFLLFFTDGDSKAKEEYIKLKEKYPNDKLIQSIKQEVDSFDRKEMIETITAGCDAAAAALGNVPSGASVP